MIPGELKDAERQDFRSPSAGRHATILGRTLGIGVEWALAEEDVTTSLLPNSTESSDMAERTILYCGSVVAVPQGTRRGVV